MAKASHNMSEKLFWEHFFFRWYLTNVLSVSADNEWKEMTKIERRMRHKTYKSWINKPSNLSWERQLSFSLSILYIFISILIHRTNNEMEIKIIQAEEEEFLVLVLSSSSVLCYFLDDGNMKTRNKTQSMLFQISPDKIWSSDGTAEQKGKVEEMWK